jgi:hypothetical protein
MYDGFLENFKYICHLRSSFKQVQNQQVSLEVSQH